MAAAISHRYRVVYFPIPKNATSSLKRLLYELDVGAPFTAEVRRSLHSTVHKLYPSPPGRWEPYFAYYTTLVVVRDPVKRLLSAYGNRVIHRKIFETDPVARKQLERRRRSLQPGLEEFVQHLETYMRFSERLREHVRPQSEYVGPFWDQIKIRLPIEQLGKLPGLIEEATGQVVTLGYEQTGGPKPSPRDLSDRHFKKIVSMFSADYEMLKEFYRPSDLPRN